MNNKREFGLIGFPLEHSFSKEYFSNKFQELNLTDCSYTNFPLKTIDELSDLVAKKQNLSGLNVTIPHKISVINFLDELDETAKQIGSVNTIQIERKNGKVHLTGYNTDCLGFMMALKPLLRNYQDRALILGNGGSSKAVQYVLKNLGIDFIVVSGRLQNGDGISPFGGGGPEGRGRTISWQELNENHIRFCKLIVNTTPLGMTPNTHLFPEIPYEMITNEHLLFDLIYNPSETEFMKRGKENGAMVSNGLTMLHQQAEAAWKIWS